MTLCRPLNIQNDTYSIAGVRLPLADNHDTSSAGIQIRIDAREKIISATKACIAETKRQITELQKCGDFDSPNRKGLNFRIHDKRKELRGLLVEQDQDEGFKEAMERKEAVLRAEIARLRSLQQ